MNWIEYLRCVDKGVTVGNCRVDCGGQKMAPHANKWSLLDGAHE